MRVPDALELVGIAYVPGVVAFYGHHTPDPWERAHNDLEVVMRAGNADMTHVAADQFVERCRALIEVFKRSCIIPKNVTPADALAIGDEQRVREWQSRKGKVCFKCGGRDGLKIVKSASSPDSVMVACGEHS